MALNSVTSCSVRPTEAAASSPHRSSQLDSPEPICEVSCRYRNTAQWRNLEHIDIEVVSHHSFTMYFKSCVACPLNTQSFALQRKVNKRFRTSCWPFSPAQCLAPRNVCTAVVTSVVIMFRTKKDVDKHVQDINSKIKNVSERNLKGYSIAKLYFGVSFHVEHFISQNSYVT